jgi:hypothetical protein
LTSRELPESSESYQNIVTASNPSTVIERNLAVKDELETLQQQVSALDAEWKEVWERFQDSDQRQQAAFNVS